MVTEAQRVAYERMMARCEPFPDGHGLRFGGAISGTGYGVVRVGDTITSAHRLAFLVRTGQSPPQVNHHCDRPACVDERCLFAGDARVNALDCAAKGRARRRVYRGAAHPRAKLRAVDVRAIRRRRAEGASLSALGAVFGVSRQTIANIIQGRRYADVA